MHMQSWASCAWRPARTKVLGHGFILFSLPTNARERALCHRVRPLPAMSNIKGIDDVKEENDDDKRQAYYAGGQGQNGGGRCASTNSPPAL